MKSGLLDTATAMNMSPYNVLVVASLVQREAKPQDFAKVARVIYNRLAEHRKLEFDSTVNYPLDRREVATTDADRGKSTPWNTYAQRRAAARRRSVRPAPTPSKRPSIPKTATGCTSSPSTRRARRCSPATINSIWRTSSWPNATVSSTARAKKAAVLGSPIAHSRSPQLHLAAYRALGLDGWTYQRIECDADELPGVVSGFGPEWVGVSVTMPGKFAALRFADERTERAELVGSANTLLRTPGGWRADNTDVDGVRGALGSEGFVTGAAVVAGSGGTAPAAIVALAELGVTDITVVARNPDKAAGLVDLARPGRRSGPVLRPERRRDQRCGRAAERVGQHLACRCRGALRGGPSPMCRSCWTRFTTRGRRRWPPR